MAARGMRGKTRPSRAAWETFQTARGLRRRELENRKQGRPPAIWGLLCRRLYGGKRLGLSAFGADAAAEGAEGET